MAIETFNNFEVRKRGCVMVEIDVPNWNQICSIINEDDVYDQDEDRKIEINPHVTVLYGFYSFVSPDDVINAIKEFPAPYIQFGNIGTFTEHPDFDVVMIKVQSEDLAKMNKALSILPNENSFPNYNPHLTIAYMKKGTAKKYEGIGIDMCKDQTPTKVIYSMPNSNKIQIDL